MNLFQTEPAVVIAVIDAVLVLLVTFGVPITGDQKAAIDGVLAAVLALAAGFITRSQVSPVASLPTPVVPPVAPVAPPTG